MLNMLIDSQEVSLYLARKFGVPDNLIRSPEQRAMIQQMAQQMMEMQQQQGMEQPIQQ